MQASHVRNLRLFLIAVICVVLVLVAYNYIQTQRRGGRIIQDAKQILSPGTARAGESIEYSDYDKGTLRFKIKAEKLLETRQGKNLLQGIEASECNADGTIGGQIRSRNAQYDRDHKQADFSGDVRIDLGQGVQLRTESLHYDLDKNIGSTDEPFEFTSNQARGKARGFRYDHDHKILHLNGNVDFVVTRAVQKPDGSLDSEEIHVTSDRGYLSRTEQLFRFEGNSHLESATALLSGDRTEATFGPDMKRLKSLFCEGSARYVSRDAVEPRTLSGDRIDFGIQGSSGALEHIDVQGNAALESNLQGSSFRLQASYFVLDLDAIKGSPTGMHGQGEAELRMKYGSDETVISGGQLEAALAGTMLQSMRVWEKAHMLMGTTTDKAGNDLRADEIRLKFQSVGGKNALQELQAERSVQLMWASDSSGRGQGASQSLEAASLTMKYGAGGDAPESGNASGNVIVEGIPSGPGNQEMRKLEADAVQFGFHPGSDRLKEFSGEGNVRVSFARPPQASLPAQEFRTSSVNIHASFRQSDGAIESLSQWGNVSMADGSRTATSGRSDYDAAKDVLVLRESPRLVDPTGVTSGGTMEYDRREKKMTIRSRVRSTMKPGAAGGRGASPFNASSGGGSPVIITAELMEYWSVEERARYSGGVQLLAEETQLAAASLERLQGGDLILAEGNVTHLILGRGQTLRSTPRKSNSTLESGIGPTRVQSDRMRYAQTNRTIYYSGSVRMHSRDIDVSCASMDAVLDETGKQFEHAVAREHVQMRQGERTINGDIAEYFPTPGKVVVSGNPAEIYDPARRGKSQARRLTFFTTDDRILLDSPLNTGAARD